ncbi:precorrin-2 C20-methyltransferase /cobalt-factor II C20-methyltransferase [Solirubrobacter pauli]|uniref:Precorrin-2 C20-methyltransferase /cobalt-factor II C20-methyltransferase n=1 Tax=Solirubrobacter pauli TaxID=166793 RepID=A0A660KYU5_9ACTN|nr:precorrin-2 C(20)-methyltransferase [Solirubrobacter pauli]RKQ86245.1 precorrin-2 C20-methyltransferase /cobalt-factor II C20-methyltransferase [Solirubrobacter pauli]
MRLIGIGVGPGDPEHLTLKALRALKEADRVFVPSLGRAAEIVSEHVECTPLDFAMSDAASRDEHWDKAGALIAEVARAGTAAFATIGDPNVYSTFTYIAHTVRALLPDVTIETVPGITAMQDLASRTGTVLAEGEERLALVPYTAGDDKLREALASFDTVIVYKGGRHLPDVLRAVDEAGREPVYGEELGRAKQTLVAPDGRAPYFSTVIAPPRRAGRGGRL